MYYLIQLENMDATFYYIPDEELIISVNEIPIMMLTNDNNAVNDLVTEYCSK